MKALKKIAAVGAAIGALVMPLVTKAATLPASLGLGYATSSGLGSKDIRDTIASIINVALSLLGIIVVVIIIYGGFLWMTAGGNEEQLTKAKQWIFGGIIGLVIILSAYAIASFVVSNLITATAGP
jgi:hypothetical protein